MGRTTLHPAIEAARAEALGQVRAYRIPLVVRGGTAVYECPECKSNSSDPGFAVWHKRGDCLIPGKNSPFAPGRSNPLARSSVAPGAKSSAGGEGGNR